MTRDPRMRPGAVVGILLAVPVVVYGAEPESQRPWKGNEQRRIYLAPGLQFGAHSQEVTLTLGRARVTSGMGHSDPIPFVDSLSWGARLGLVGGGWSPAAVHGLLFLSRTAWAGWFWPQGLEVAGGYGGGSGRGYGIGQLSYVVGIGSRVELNATWQATVGSSSPRPDWFSTWVFGLRYGFDLARPKSWIVTLEERPDGT
jgi:hypothetical protein